MKSCMELWLYFRAANPGPNSSYIGRPNVLENQNSIFYQTIIYLVNTIFIDLEDITLLYIIM